MDTRSTQFTRANHSSLQSGGKALPLVLDVRDETNVKDCVNIAVEQ